MDSSEYVTLSAEPTVVVAIAAGLASVGAAMGVKLADLNAGASGASPSPPQADSRPAPDTPAPKGSSGRPANIFRVLRRVGVKVWDMGFFMRGCETATGLREARGRGQLPGGGGRPVAWTMLESRRDKGVTAG